MNWTPALGALLAGLVLGAGLTYHLACGPTASPERGTVTEDTTRMGWGELMATLPTETTVRAPDSSRQECMEVPETIVDTTRPPPDTVYHRLYAETKLEAPSVTYGERAGLDVRAKSRYPFLYLPLLSGGEPAIEHDGRRTTVRAYGPRRGYEFTYTYEPPAFQLWTEGYAAAAWTPPTAPTSVRLHGGARLGATIRRGAWRIEPSVGGALTPIGPAATAGLSLRSVIAQL
jgi:hypothetical protein